MMCDQYFIGRAISLKPKLEMYNLLQLQCLLRSYEDHIVMGNIARALPVPWKGPEQVGPLRLRFYLALNPPLYSDFKAPYSSP